MSRQNLIEVTSDESRAILVLNPHLHRWWDHVLVGGA